MYQRILKILNSKQFIRFALIVMCIILFIQADRRFGYTLKEAKENYPISADGTGYYAYLPQYLIYKNSPNYSFYTQINKKYPTTDFFSMVKKSEDGKTAYNKFYVGTALLQLPFYAVSHVIQVLCYGQGDGYSLGYRFSIQLAALFYWLVGVAALFSLFKRLNYSRFTILVAIISITFGTNLNYYLAYNPCYSHIYSFGIIALFLNLAHLWATKNQSIHLLYLSICLGLILILRPVNVLVIFILPFFFKNWNHFISRLIELFKKQFSSTVICMLAFLFVVFIQFLAHFTQTNEWSFFGYENEGFTNILRPQFWNVFFSYEKGFFVYAPLMLIVIPGIYFFYKKTTSYFFFGWMLTLFASFYFICSWWDWQYGGGFGMRVLIDYLPFLVFPMLAIFARLNKYLTLGIYPFVFVGIFIYQTFQIQFNQNIILYSGMNKAKFWQIFMKTEGRYSWMLSYHYEKIPTNANNKLKSFIFENDEWKANLGLSRLNFRLKKNEITLTKNTFNVPRFALLTGDAKIYDPVNNPTLESVIYLDGKVIYSNKQPFGYQIDRVGKFYPIHIEFNPELNVNPDSVKYIFHNYGERNDFKNLTITLLETD